MDYQSQTAFQPYLLPGERILWTGRPKQGFTLSPRDTFLIPFSLMWGGFAIFWNYGVWMSFPNSGTPDDWFFKLWGLPFLVVGLYLIAGRFVHDAHIRKNLFYGVTDQRILIVRRKKITSLDIHRLPRLELSEHRDGTGTLAFEAANFGPWRGMSGFGWWLPAMTGIAQFFRVPHPRNVYELIRKQTQP